jgi:hypothetical protein
MKILFVLLSTLLLPIISFAGTIADGDAKTSAIGSFLGNIILFINNILFPLALAIAFIALVWGIVKYFVIGGDSDDGKSKGKDLIIYSVVGFVIILSFYGIINVLANGLGFSGKSLDLSNVKSKEI